jgi:hypothetical protein
MFFGIKLVSYKEDLNTQKIIHKTMTLYVLIYNVI